MKILRAVFYGLLIEVAAISAFWGAAHLEGSRWAALLGLAALPLLLLRFPEKGRRR